MACKILLVEDNQDLRNSLCRFFIEDGCQVSTVASTEDAIDAVDEKDFDIAIIDINLPGKSGFSLIEYIRENGKQYPLIAMTARDTITDKVRGFELGLTDYIVKPFDLLELRARVHAHTKQQATESIKTKRFEVRPKSVEFLVDGRKTEVTQLELRILEILLKNNHLLVPIDDLIEFAWGNSPDFTNPPVRIHIANIRKKIQDTDFSIIRTIPGKGYIFNDPSQENK